jgi:hypothetical protein
MGRKLLIEAIEEAAASPKGVCYADEMVTLVSYDDGTITIRKFKLEDIGDDHGQMTFLHEVLLDECPVKQFTDWAHLEARGKNRYPNGTGYGRGLIEGVLSKHGCTDPSAVFETMLADGRIIDLGYFNASVGGSFQMYAAVRKVDTYA